MPFFNWTRLVLSSTPNTKAQWPPSSVFLGKNTARRGSFRPDMMTHRCLGDKLLPVTWHRGKLKPLARTSILCCADVHDPKCSTKTLVNKNVRADFLSLVFLLKPWEEISEGRLGLVYDAPPAELEARERDFRGTGWGWCAMLFLKNAWNLSSRCVVQYVAEERKSRRGPHAKDIWRSCLHRPFLEGEPSPTHFPRIKRHRVITLVSYVRVIE